MRPKKCETCEGTGDCQSCGGKPELRECECSGCGHLHTVWCQACGETGNCPNCCGSGNARDMTLAATVDLSEASTGDRRGVAPE